MLIDSHCHIHEADYPIDVKEAIQSALGSGVGKMICIGTNYDDSKRAIALAKKYPSVFATIGIHPQHASDGLGKLESLIDKDNPKIVAIGEIGLDYHYQGSQPVEQIRLMKQQIELALKYQLPIVFHVREAYDDFWTVLDGYKQEIKGVLHCFTDTEENVQKAIKRGLYIGVNGLSTFTKDPAQQNMFKNIPLDNLIIETDAPYLTPVPFRGKINQPAFVREVAEFIGQNRDISADKIASATTKNVEKLFHLR